MAQAMNEQCIARLARNCRKTIDQNAPVFSCHQKCIRHLIVNYAIKVEFIQEESVSAYNLGTWAQPSAVFVRRSLMSS